MPNPFNLFLKTGSCALGTGYGLAWWILAYVCSSISTAYFSKYLAFFQKGTRIYLINFGAPHAPLLNFFNFVTQPYIGCIFRFIRIGCSMYISWRTSHVSCPVFICSKIFCIQANLILNRNYFRILFHWVITSFLFTSVYPNSIIRET